MIIVNDLSEITYEWKEKEKKKRNLKTSRPISCFLIFRMESSHGINSEGGIIRLISS